MIKILCDANMPFAREAFTRLGQVRLVDGRAISAEDVRDVDVLATRSTTRIDRCLLDGSRVRFYGTATIGYDHVDTGYLEDRGITWMSAAGCNAESVAQYVTAALTVCGGASGLEGMTLGVVGAGNVGRRVMTKARALGMKVLVNDPPRAGDPEDVEAAGFVSLDTLLRECDAVTLHTPLTRSGPLRTLGLIDRDKLALMRPGAWLFNTARGGIVDEEALAGAVAGGRLSRVVLDTWRGEPGFSPGLAAMVNIATPHIAGHSYEGKVNGTMMVYVAACRFFGANPDFSPRLPAPPTPCWQPSPIQDEVPVGEQTGAAVRASYDILADDRKMREAAALDNPQARAGEFDRLRKNYPMRREFAATRVPSDSLSPVLLGKLAGLGFTIV